jgi:hypothetical protein
MADWREALVAVAAHEARHLWQYATTAPRSEVDAERHAARTLAAYREALASPNSSRARESIAEPGSGG